MQTFEIPGECTGWWHFNRSASGGTPDALTSHGIFEAVQASDALAVEAFELTGRQTGLVRCSHVPGSDNSGGRPGCPAGDLIFKPTQRSMEEHLLDLFRNKVMLLPSGLKQGDTAVLGASALIWDDLGKKH